jgi:hypothetical protein
MNIRKTLKVLGIATLIVITGVCGVVVNSYLSESNLFIYATGTTEKAFLNATWKMSPKEIERANHTCLSSNLIIDPFIWDIPHLSDTKRFKFLIQEDIRMWGYRADIQYAFHANIPNLYSGEYHSEILQTLNRQFGNAKDVQIDDSFERFEWETEKQRIKFVFQMVTKDPKKHRASITAVYKPLYDQMTEIARNDTKAYF